MPFRDRVRKALGRSRSNSDNSDQSSTSPKPSAPAKPKPKDPASDAAPSYRRRLGEAHQARMAAFSWAENPSRQMSDASQYSPKGSRLPSRETSRSSMRDRKSMQGQRRRGPHLVNDAENDDVANSAPGTSHSMDRRVDLHSHDAELEDPRVRGGRNHYTTQGGSQMTNEQLSAAVKQSMLHVPTGMSNAIST